MCDVCGGITAQEYADSIEARIRTYGWTVQYVEGDGERNPGFGYTIGLTQYDHPEIIVFDPGSDSAYLSLEPLAWAVLAGDSFGEGDDLSEFFPPPDRAELLSFPDSATHLFTANTIFRDVGDPPVPALQLVRTARNPFRTASGGR
ncbi:DUF4262 domain-containing protein [Kribbella sp. NPDC058245]|uniref:DUF4262 domain-containing protein n=1 Tax=Kribbella sp. NPDC058245 TaxID=3346399 RepID=UPI0036F0B4BE